MRQLGYNHDFPFQSLDLTVLDQTSRIFTRPNSGIFAASPEPAPSSDKTTGADAQTCNLILNGVEVTIIKKRVQYIGDDGKIIILDPIKRLNSAPEVIRAFGGKPAYDDAIHALTDELYKAA